MPAGAARPRMMDFHARRPHLSPVEHIMGEKKPFKAIFGQEKAFSSYFMTRESFFRVGVDAGEDAAGRTEHARMPHLFPAELIMGEKKLFKAISGQEKVFSGRENAP